MSDTGTSVVFLGDVFLPSPVGAVGLIEGQYVCNFESPLTSRETPVPGKILLRTRQNHLAATFGRMPLAVCLANNHILDYGVGGLNDTLENFESAGVVCFGAGSAAACQRNPAVVHAGDFRLGLLGYLCPSTNPAKLGGAAGDWISLLSSDRVQADIACCRAMRLDRIIVSLHWGQQEVPLPRPEDVALAHRLIEAGADLIIGHHAHCIQGWEVYRERPVFYGLGNTIFPDFDVLVAESDGNVKRMEHCIWRRWNRTSLAVYYEPVSNRCEAKVLRLVGNRLVSLRQDAERYRINTAAPNYARQFRRAQAWGNLRNALGRYCARPKLPRLRHLSSLSSWARQVARG